MPLPVVSDSYLVRLIWSSSHAPRPASNDLCIHDDAGGHTGTDVYNAMDAHVTANMWILVPAVASIVKVVTTKLDGTSASIDHATGSPSKWTGGGNAPDQLDGCAVVTLRTGFRGRSRRGRIYLPWMGQGNSTDGIITAGNVATCQAAWDTFRAAMKTAGFPLHVLSRKHSDSIEIVSETVQPYVKSQRRRNRR